jgi:hypothetical protein
MPLLGSHGLGGINPEASADTKIIGGFPAV